MFFWYLYLFLLIVFYSSSLFVMFLIATIMCTDWCVVLLMSCTYFFSCEHKMLSSSWSVIVFFLSLQQCARRVSCVVVANRQTLACHLIFLKRALLCICTLQNLHISQRAWCICTLENFIFLNVHYVFSHLKFYIFPMCTMYFNTGKVHIFQHARCTLENFVFPNMHALVAHFIFLNVHDVFAH